MARGSVLRFAGLLAVLAFLLPLAAGADSCSDCLWAASPECCPPSCCSCCIHGLSVLTPVVWGAPRPASVATEPGPQESWYPSSPPRDVFHVPKPSLV